MKKETNKKLLVILYVIIGLCIAYFVLPKAVTVFLPFILAYIISAVMRPFVKLLHKKLKLPKKLAACISTFLVVGILGYLIYYVSFRLVLYIQQVVADWDSIQAYWTDIGNNLYGKVQGMYANASPDVQNVIDVASESLVNSVKSLLTPVVNAVIGFATEFAIMLPSAIIFTVVMFLATYFMLAEDELIVGVAKKIFGERVVKRVSAVYKDMIKALGGYLRAQLLIMAIVSVPLMIGMYLAGVEHFVLIAILIAVFDALPVFGSGAILLPWALYGVVAGEYGVSIIMVGLYLTIIIVRQMLEPKIVGKQIGVPPIFTLISMYAGLKLFGIAGMILGPVCVLIIRNLYASGVFKSYLAKRYENAENPENTDNTEQKGDIDGQ